MINPTWQEIARVCISCLRNDKENIAARTDATNILQEIAIGLDEQEGAHDPIEFHGTAANPKLVIKKETKT